MAVDPVVDKSARQQIAQNLAQVLADTYILYVMTQNFHWNIIDPRFYSLHKMFQEQYEDLAKAIDDLAEQIRILDIKAPGSMRQFLEMGTIEEVNANLNGDEMIKQLLQSHETLCKHIRPLISKFQTFGDEGTADLLIERLRVHEKTAWMLRSHFA
jgi:starvation-inducible DNA-binding protein